MNAYDLLAPHYRRYSARRENYLRAVDRFVVENAPRNACAMLDVGAGDGVRGMALARKLGIGTTVLCDNSEQMAERCRSLGATHVWTNPAESLPHTEQRFDMILCLWNVLGHLPDCQTRIRALKGMRALLAKGGALFLDINNRHNAAAYGWLRVTGRMVLDGLYPDVHRGDAVFEWNIEGQRIPGAGHLFTASEVECLFDAAKLCAARRVAIDYVTGCTSSWHLRGQLVYMLIAGGDG